MLVQGKEVEGDTKFKVTQRRFEYLFANAENKATFEKDPARYEIQLDGACARMGAPTTGNPDLYTVHNGRIYIFGSEECQTAPGRCRKRTAPHSRNHDESNRKSNRAARVVRVNDEGAIV